MSCIKYVCFVNDLHIVYRLQSRVNRVFEPPRGKTNKMACAPSEDSDQPGHPPSLIKVFAKSSLTNELWAACMAKRLV